MMDPILKPFADRLGAVPRHEPVIPWVSNLHGGWITEGEATDPSYWTDHLRGTVRFGDGLSTLLEDPDRILLEVGPGQTLTSLANSHPAASGRTIVTSLPHAMDRSRRRAAPDRCARAAVRGRRRYRLERLSGRVRRRRVPLPTYPFERQRYWIDEKPHRTAGAVPASSPVVKADSPDDWVWVPTWRRTAPTHVPGHAAGAMARLG